MDAAGATLLGYIFSSSLAFLLLTLLLKSFGILRTKNGSVSPPSPPSLPIIGHLHLVGSVIPKSFQALARRYGPLIQLRLGASTCVVVSNAQVAKEVMKAHDLNFCNRPQFGSSENYLYKDSDFITVPYGPYWRFIKKLCVTQLLSTTQLGRLRHIRQQEIEKLLKSLLECSSEGRETDLSRDLTALTNNGLCRMAMSTTCLDHNDGDDIIGLVTEFMDLAAKLSIGDVLGPLGKFDLFGYGKKLVRIVGKFDGILERILQEHEANNSERGDMMDILLRVHKDPNAEMRLTRNDIKAFFLVSSYLLPWTFTVFM